MGRLHGFGRRLTISQDLKVANYKIGNWKYDEFTGYGQRINKGNIEEGIFCQDLFLKQDDPNLDLSKCGNFKSIDFETYIVRYDKQIRDMIK